MGLDVRFSSHIERVPDADEEAGWILSNTDFPARGDDVEPGRYALGGVTGEFRAGAYSGYNRWRELLSETMLGLMPRTIWNDPETYAGRPFVELINFTDCDGFIGPKTAAKLFADFNAGRKAFFSAVEDAWDRERYDNFTRAFKHAALGGVVVFC